MESDGTSSRLILGNVFDYFLFNDRLINKLFVYRSCTQQGCRKSTQDSNEGTSKITAVNQNETAGIKVSSSQGSLLG